VKLTGAPLPAGAPRHETQQPPHRYATGGKGPGSIYGTQAPITALLSLTAADTRPIHASYSRWDCAWIPI